MISRKMIVSVCTLAAGMLLAAVFAVGVHKTAQAAEPAICNNGTFEWVCTNGSEAYKADPTVAVSGDNGHGFFTPQLFTGAAFYGNNKIELRPGITMRFVTAQPYGAWWGADGKLQVVKNLNGTITIPSGAVLVSIPGDILGNFDLPGWVKGKKIDTGEYVLGHVK